MRSSTTSPSFFLESDDETSIQRQGSPSWAGTGEPLRLGGDAAYRTVHTGLRNKDMVTLFERLHTLQIGRNEITIIEPFQWPLGKTIGHSTVGAGSIRSLLHHTVKPTPWLAVVTHRSAVAPEACTHHEGNATLISRDHQVQRKGGEPGSKVTTSDTNDPPIVPGQGWQDRWH